MLYAVTIDDPYAHKGRTLLVPARDEASALERACRLSLLIDRRGHSGSPEIPEDGRMPLRSRLRLAARGADELIDRAGRWCAMVVRIGGDGSNLASRAVESLDAEAMAR